MNNYKPSGKEFEERSPRWTQPTVIARLAVRRSEDVLTVLRYYDVRACSHRGEEDSGSRTLGIRSEKAARERTVVFWC